VAKNMLLLQRADFIPTALERTFQIHLKCATLRKKIVNTPLFVKPYALSSIPSTLICRMLSFSLDKPKSPQNYFSEFFFFLVEMV